MNMYASRTRFFTSLVVLVAGCFAAPSSAGAQSLGEIAKRTQEARDKAAAEQAKPEDAAKAKGAEKTADDKKAGGNTAAQPGKKVYTSADLAPAPPPAAALSAAELAEIDRTTFDKAYAAGKAVDAAKYEIGQSISRARFADLVLEFKTQLDIVADKVKTRGENELLSKYLMAYLTFDLAQVESRTQPLKSVDTMQKAGQLLDAANDIYLAKPAQKKLE